MTDMENNKFWQFLYRMRIFLSVHEIIFLTSSFLRGYAWLRIWSDLILMETKHSDENTRQKQVLLITAIWTHQAVINQVIANRMSLNKEQCPVIQFNLLNIILLFKCYIITQILYCYVTLLYIKVMIANIMVNVQIFHFLKYPG